MDFRRLFDLLHYQAARFPNKAALVERGVMGWHHWSTADCIKRMNEMSAALLELGLLRGDRAAIYAEGGSPDWILLDLALQQIGVVVVPIHVGLTRDELAYMLKTVAVKSCFTANREGYEDIQSLRSSVLSLEHLMTFRSMPDIPSLEDKLRMPSPENLEYIQTLRAGIHEDDTATILFTSGTSGKPRGVRLSHKNIVSNLKSVIAIVPVSYKKRVISFLPLSHIFERVVIYTYLAVGASIHFAEKPSRLYENMREIRPHYLTVVPLVLERFYADIQKVTAQKPHFKRQVLVWAVNQGKLFNGRFRIAPIYWLKLLIADVLVFRHWRRRLGGRIEGLVSGAAALRPELARLFSAAGIAVREGYGLTEASPVVTCNRFEPGGYRFGSAGMPIPGVQVRIQSREGEMTGEIQVKGPNIMQGYLDDEEGNKDVFTEDGWLRTGDIGYFEDKRFLHVLGRASNVFKTASGRFVAVRNIEQELEQSPFIDQTIVVGRNQPWLGALIVPDFRYLEGWCEQENIHWTAPEYMVHNPLVLKKFENETDRINKDLHPQDRIRTFQLIPDSWTLENGMLTPTFKKRRALIENKYAKAYDQLFPQT